MPLVTIESPAQFQQVLSEDLTRLSVSYFRAEWAEPCKTMDAKIAQLAQTFPQVLFLVIDAEAQPDISESFDVDSVPLSVVLRGHQFLNRILGAKADELQAAIQRNVNRPVANAATTLPAQAPPSGPLPGPVPSYHVINEKLPENVEDRCHAIMQSAPVVLFMKGDPETPRCGFSRKLVGILSDKGIQFSSFDILEDEAVRQKLKEINDWPTFPQLIIKGEFVGGLDVVTEMAESGELEELLA